MSEDRERRARRVGLAVFGLMLLIWIALSGVSFVRSRHRPDSSDISFAGQTAAAGKRVFQAYSCMDCHTIVGNGAYFAPDLTFIYKKVGPAWLEAFLSSPGTWPSPEVVRIWIDRLREGRELAVPSLAAYEQKYPGAAERLEERAGQGTLMPNLPFKAREIRALVAFLEYTSRINTGGWPPVPEAASWVIRKEKIRLGLVPAAGASSLAAPASAAAKPPDAVAQGRKLASEYGCSACHSTDGSRRVGPSWKNLFGSNVVLNGGVTVRADTAYLRESVLDPNAQVVKGYPASVMPPFKGRLTAAQLAAIVAYIQSLSR